MRSDRLFRPVVTASAAGVIVGLFLGCSSPRPTDSAVADAPAPRQAVLPAHVQSTTPTDIDAATRPVTDVPASVAAPRPAQPQPGAQPNDPGNVAENQRNAQIGEQERRQAYAHFMRLGRERLSQGRFEEAVRMFEEATQLFPSDAEATRMLTDARSLLGRDAGRSFNEFRSARDREIERLTEGLAQVRLLTQDGKRMFDERNYKDAIDKLNEALRIAGYLRGQVDTSSQEKYIRSLIEKAKELAEVQRVEDLRYNRLLVEQIREVERQNRVRRWREEIRTLYESARDQFDREEYDECLITLSKILWKDPYNEDVIRLREYCRNLKYQKRNRDLKHRMAVMWQQTLAELDDASIPFVGEIYEAELPSIERWREIEMRAQQVLERQTTPEDPEVARIKEIMRQKDVNLRFNESPLNAVVQYLSQEAGVNIILSKEVRDQGLDEEEITLPVSQVKLGSALSLLMDYLQGLRFFVENGAIIIGTEEEAHGKGVITRIFNVKDLLGGYRMFPGEQIRLDRDEPDWGENQDEEEPIEIVMDDLPDLVMQAVAPDSWDQDVTNVQVGPNGTLIARNTIEILGEVGGLLDDLRQSRGMMVTIECRIIEVQDNFLEEIGIDYRGSGGVPPGAVGPNLTAAPLDEFQFGLNLAQVPTGMPVIGRDNSVGIYWSNAPDSEVRARVEQMFDQALGDPDILTSAGGASFQFAFLDRVQLNAILRAVKKRERANLVTAPKITCFNTQRANITVRNQVAYIQDFDVQAQQNVSIADPVVGTIEDGLVLDIRPVISADRRYITVEVQPTIALLQRPMATLTTTLGGQGSTPVTIQLPELRVQRIRTTVTVPDGGAFLIGGVRRMSDQSMETGVPMFSDIPILGNLFTRRGKAKLRNDLVIVIKARITDLRELINTFDPSATGTDDGLGR